MTEELDKTRVDSMEAAEKEAAETKAAEEEAAELEAAEAESAESKELETRRQSLVLRTGSCDMRVGVGTTELLPVALKVVCNKPRRTVLLSAEGTSPDLVEQCRRLLVDTGYEVRQKVAVGGRVARSFAQAAQYSNLLAQEGITAEDPVVVIGDADLISGVLFATSTWYGGCPLVAVPTTLDGMVDIVGTPRYVDLDGHTDVLYAKGNVRVAVCDFDNLPALDGALDDGTLMGRAVLVAGAIASGNNTFSNLAVAADKILAGDAEALQTQIMDISKARARIAAASALAQRQGVQYGVGIARALRVCLDKQEADTERYLVDTNVCDARLLAEGMRIAARLGAGNKPEESKLVDLVFTQDALLDKFGLSEVACVIDPADLYEAMRAVEFEHQNRFMPAIPMDWGRVRFTTLEEDLLKEHLGAWCKARRKLARRRAKEVATN